MIAYQIAKENKILVIDEPLGIIDGYYNKVDGKKFIHVNSTLPELYKKFVVAHQLYYAINDIDYRFLINKRFNADYEAKKYALDLLDVKKLLKQYGSINNLCKAFGIEDKEEIKLFKERMLLSS